MSGLRFGPRPLLRGQSARGLRPATGAAPRPGPPQLLQRLIFSAGRLDSFSFTPILNLMVKYQDAILDRTFAAIADPTRRAMLARLQAHDTLSISELAQPFDMSLPAVMKHLDVLTDA